MFKSKQPRWHVSQRVATSPRQEVQLRRVNPLGRAGRPEEIAEVVWFLADAAPEFLTGTTIFVDGGQTALAPML